MANSIIREEWKTTANVITIIRVLLIPVFVVMLIAPWPEWLYMLDPMENAEYITAAVKPWVAAVAYAALALTDGIDGYIARKRNEVTTLGKFMDPLADKILVAAALLALIELGDLPSWVVLIIISREFIVSGLRMIAAAEGIIIAARWSGKVKTALTLVAIVMFIVKRSSILMNVSNGFYLAFYVLSWIVMIAALIVTVTSMIQYFLDTFRMLGEKDAQRNALTADAKRVLDLARDHGVRIATAESCTGGLVGAKLTEIPGSSDVYDGGVVSYSYDMKESLLSVEHETLEEVGAVSEEVARQMAEGALDVCKRRVESDRAVAVSVTGVAGPGKSENKEAGTVWFGIAGLGPTEAMCCNFHGGRDEVRKQAADYALTLIANRIGQLDAGVQEAGEDAGSGE
ncbi:MAG: CDP-diacylglycerol--glycerol-3-phosphate 3-phosphatidyltransferase [Coriobacteriales bacterium]